MVEHAFSEPSAQQKQVTVLFVDFSPLLQPQKRPMGPDSEFSSTQKRLEAVVESYSGVLESGSDSQSNSLIALFGVPIAQENDPRRAIRAALTMQAEIATLYHLPSHLHNNQLRVGISTGALVVRSVEGSESYSAEGEPLEVARFLMESAPPGGVVLSQDSYRLIRDTFEVKPLPALESPQGKSLSSYLLQSERPRAFRVSHQIEGSQSPLIGRQEELEKLKKAFVEAATSEQLRIVTLVGEAGMGKSRLLYEFNQWVEERPETVRFFKGRASPQMSTQPYSLIRDLFAYRFGLQDSDRLTMARAKLEQGIRKFMGSEGTEKAHVLGQLLGYDFSDSPYLRGILEDARQVRDRAFHYATLFFEEMTVDRSRAVRLMKSASGHGERPVVALFLEDIHWADEGSLDLIEHLVRECPTIPMLMVCLARPFLWERRPTWGRSFLPTHHLHLDLAPLTPAESRHLVSELLHRVEQVPTELEELLVNRTDGNPFYVEELIKMLIEDGVILAPEGGGSWTVAPERLSSVRVPPTLMGVLQARMDALPLLERETLQRAAVIGRVFWDQAISHLMGESADNTRQIAASLGTLKEKELIIERQSGAFSEAREFVFKHTLLQEVAYDSVIKRRLQNDHRQIAEWLVVQSGEGPGFWAGTIGEHYERAGEESLAADWYERAGRAANESYAPAAAIEHYQRALRFLSATEEAGRRAALYQGLGEMLQLQSRYVEAGEAYRAMEACARQNRDPVVQARAWTGLSDVQTKQGDYRVAIESAQQAQSVTFAAGTEFASALVRQGWALMRISDMEAAFTLGEQALALSTALKLRDMIARSLKLLGSILTTQGRSFEQAAAYFGEALALARDLGNQQEEGMLLNNLGVLAFKRGDYRTAVARYAEALTIAKKIGSRDLEGLLMDNLGEAHVGLGEYEVGAEKLRRAIEMAEVAGRGEFASIAYSYLAKAYLGQGKIEEALTTAKHALALGQKSGAQAHIAAAWRALGMIGAQQEAPESPPADCFAEAQRLYIATGAEVEHARTLREWARYELTTGSSGQGLTLWQEARDLFMHLGLDIELKRMEQRPGR
ncbi:MAG: tetratricopeptide repeat protein [Ardenticatenales bacterium]|nr:tetratricopeptide repeat protein [Ardenticatenales bacterium]